MDEEGDMNTCKGQMRDWVAERGEKEIRGVKQREREGQRKSTPLISPSEAMKFQTTGGSNLSDD